MPVAVGISEAVMAMRSTSSPRAGRTASSSDAAEAKAQFLTIIGSPRLSLSPVTFITLAAEGEYILLRCMSPNLARPQTISWMQQTETGHLNERGRPFNP